MEADNKQRAAWAAQAIENFKSDIGETTQGVELSQEDAVDLVANILHLAHIRGWDVEGICRMAANHYEAEFVEEEQERAQIACNSVVETK